MSCVNWAMPGEVSVKKPPSWGAVGISRIGLENGSKSLDLYFLTDYHISLFTRYSWRLFFFLLSPRSFEVSVQVPSCFGAVQCHCHAVWWAQTSPFCQFFVKLAATLLALWTLRLVLLYQVFQHHTWIHKCVKERKQIFLCLESNHGMRSCSSGYGI